MSKRINISPMKIRNWKPVLLIALLAAGFVWFLKTNTSILEGMEDKASTIDNETTTSKNDASASSTTNSKNGKAKNGDSSKPMSGDDIKKILSKSS